MLITEMEMPERCLDCQLNSDMKCSVNGNTTFDDIMRPRWCPLHEIKIELLETQELWYTPREVRNALMEYGQHDPNIKLGEIIKYDPVQVEDILIGGREETKPAIPHMVDWGIYECPKCKTRVDKTYNFCKHCGRPVKWE